MRKPTDSDPYLRAYQNAFRPELEAAVRSYCLAAGARILDCPCGDGFYTAIFAEHMTSGALVAADVATECLDRARVAVRPAAASLTVEYVEADSYRLPFDDDSFDLAWCATSFITLDDPVRALRELRRVTRPGGRVAVLETDEYHSVLLPWPVGLELALYRAIREESRLRYGSGGKFSQTRRLRAEFLEAGLTPAVKRTVVADRVAPFSRAERELLARYFDHLRELVHMGLTPREMQAFDHATDPHDPESLLNREDVELTTLATLSLGAKS